MQNLYNMLNHFYYSLAEDPIHMMLTFCSNIILGVLKSYQIDNINIILIWLKMYNNVVPDVLNALEDSINTLFILWKLFVERSGNVILDFLKILSEVI